MPLPDAPVLAPAIPERRAEEATPPGRVVLALLLAASSLTVMSGATIAPSLPGLARHFASVPDAELLARLALTLPALLIAICAPVMGLLVDRHGPRAVLFWSTILYVAGGASGLLAPDLTTLLVGRAVLGVAVAGVMTATTTLIGGLYPPPARDRVLGLQGAAMAAGGVVFLSMGALLAEIGWRLPFAIYALPVVLVPLIAARLPRPAQAEAAEVNRAVARVPWARLAGFYLLALGAMTLFYIVPIQLPFRMAAAGFEDAALSGYAIAVSTFASAGTALLFGRIKAAVPATGAIALTFLGLGAGLLLAGTFDAFATIALAMLIAGAGAGLIMPTLTSLVLAATPPERHGRASGGLSTSLFLRQFLSPIVLAAAVPGNEITDIFIFAGTAAFTAATGFGLALAAGRLRASPTLSKEAR